MPFIFFSVISLQTKEAQEKTTLFTFLIRILFLSHKFIPTKWSIFIERTISLEDYSCRHEFSFTGLFFLLCMCDVII